MGRRRAPRTAHARRRLLRLAEGARAGPTGRLSAGRLSAGAAGSRSAACPTARRPRRLLVEKRPLTRSLTRLVPLVTGKLLQVAPASDPEAWVVRARGEPAARSGPALLVRPSELWRTGPRRLRNRGSGGALLNFRGLSDGISVRAHGDEDSAGGSEAACRRASPRTRFKLRRIASPPPPPPPPRTASTLPQPAPVTAASAEPLPTPQHAALDSPPLNSSLGP
mmetsp:Transcript_17424/g.58615  ORF Transcript_17424/g.58615 Transcript_17424/m.58615 type:complete len:223 (-) Transcript_17424:101-769(-)